jgi:rhodanese-related sulfurtransferase
MFGILKKLMGNDTDFKALVRSGAVIVDVRTPEEYRLGHIKGSKNFPLDSIQRKVDELKRGGVPVITVCRSGARSGMAKSILAAAGIEVYNGGSWNGLQAKIQ